MIVASSYLVIGGYIGLQYLIFMLYTYIRIYILEIIVEYAEVKGVGG